MRRAAAVVVLTTAAMATTPGGASAEPAAGDIPGHFVGVSIEWTLIDRYMGPNARPGFANLLRNLDTGTLRIGGSSQDQVPFDATAPDSDRVINQDRANAKARAAAVMPAVRLRQVVTCESRCCTAAFIAP